MGLHWTLLLLCCTAACLLLTLQLDQLYKAANVAGVPCIKLVGADFWDSLELKTSLALLRCAASPSVSGNALRGRLSRRGGGLKVPLLNGLGAQQHIWRAALVA